jgi:hypothetical protein
MARRQPAREQAAGEARTDDDDRSHAAERFRSVMRAYSIRFR